MKIYGVTTQPTGGGGVGLSQKSAFFFLDRPKWEKFPHFDVYLGSNSLKEDKNNHEVGDQKEAVTFSDSPTPPTLRG